MARAIWSGAISFGLVNLPVRLYSATSSHHVSFRQLQKGTGERIRYRRVAEESGEEVRWEDIVKGYELEKGEYVVLTPEELEAIEPRKSRVIDIEEFVDIHKIDPITWDKTYYLGPAENVGADKPYALLHRAMEETRKVGVGRFVMRTKEYLATVRPVGSLLGLETMYFADEIRGVEEVENAPPDVEVDERELGLATELIQALSADWQHEKYRDTYRERVVELVERKASGERIVAKEPRERAKVVNLMDALRASLQSRGASASEAAGGVDGDLAALSKTELYERASDADIAGRSKMTKDELIRALRRQAS